MVLAGHGLRLRIHRGSLVVSHGFTHYPQKAREQRFFPGDPKLPSRIILLSVDGSISLDVVRWLSEQHVPLVMLDYRGQVVSVLGTETTAADLELRRAQMGALTDDRGLALASTLIEQKLSASLDTLATLPASTAQESAIDRVASLLHRLHDDPPADHRRPAVVGGLGGDLLLRGVAYDLAALEGHGQEADPSRVETGGYAAGLPAAPKSGAHHPVNAMLNYGYARSGKPGSDCDCRGRARPEYWLPARLPAGAAGYGVRPGGALQAAGRQTDSVVHSSRCLRAEGFRD